ncbi:hypothetical protein RJ639_012301 [Escallonia herrerae]|uniref:Dihydroxyacetone kinase n=1 Tax=Escallonia herrerae TaxID=1293975 RepID=A0AA88VMB1_9ASTE|nr:hypothetical protein RJ639_012301 [Escallonia herrerae]
MELMIAAGKAVPRLQLEHGLAVDRVYTGSLMTSLDMAGFSITLMKADPAILQRLDAATKAPYWPVGVDGNRPPAKIPVPLPPSHVTKNDETLSRPQQLSEEGHILEVAIQAAAAAVINLRDSLNEWDSKAGDGDCGSTMFRGATAILEDMKKYYPLNDATETVYEIGSSIRRVMGGTSGIIYDIFFKAAYGQLKAKNHQIIEPVHYFIGQSFESIGSGADALEAAIAAVSKYGGARAGYRTLLDALIPASLVLKERLTAGDDPADAFVLASEAALAGAESTKLMQAQAGRATYISGEILASVPDPGAVAAASWFRAAALAVKEKCQAS